MQSTNDFSPWQSNVQLLTQHLGSNRNKLCYLEEQELQDWMELPKCNFEKCTSPLVSKVMLLSTEHLLGVRRPVFSQLTALILMKKKFYDKGG